MSSRRGALHTRAVPRRPTQLTLLVLLSSLLGAAACAGAPAPRAEPPPARSAPAPEPVAQADAAVESEPAPVEPPPPAEPVERAVTIGAGGDILCHLKVVRSAREHESGFDHVFGRLREVIGDDEVAFANLETPLSERIDPETGEPPVLGAPGSVAPALAAAGIDVVSVANNHSYDQMATGLGDTLRALADAQVGAAGASEDLDAAPGPVVIERDGVRVAVVAFTERVNRGPAVQGEYVRVARYDDDAARAALARARAQADVVLLSIHWSHDFIETPRIAQRERARLLVDAGADVIIGHGPHVLQEVERMESPRGDAVVAYSLGNLVSNQGLRYWAGRRIPENMHPAVVLPTVRDGAWLRARFVVSEDGLRIDSLTAVPLWTVNNYLDVALDRADVLDVHVGPLREMPEEYRIERLPEIAAALGQAVTIVEAAPSEE